MGTQSLLHARADPNVCDKEGVGLLHLAVFDGQVELCRELLKAKSDPNFADQHGQTPMFFAPTTSICELLFQNRADPGAVNHRSQSALHLAAHAGFIDVLVWLSSRVTRAVLEFRDNHGATAADYACHTNAGLDVLQGLQACNGWNDPSLACTMEVQPD